jgi:hypothetical protein
MVSILAKFFWGMSILVGLFLSLDVFRFLNKEKYARKLLTLPRANLDRFIALDKRIIRLYKLSISLFILCLAGFLVIASVLKTLFPREVLSALTTCITLQIVLLGFECLLRQWLVRYLEKETQHDSLQNL